MISVSPSTKPYGQIRLVPPLQGGLWTESPLFWLWPTPTAARNDLPVLFAFPKYQLQYSLCLWERYSIFEVQE